MANGAWNQLYHAEPEPEDRRNLAGPPIYHEPTGLMIVRHMPKSGLLPIRPVILTSQPINPSPNGRRIPVQRGDS